MRRAPTATIEAYGYNRGYAQPYYGAYGGPAVGIGVGPFGIGVF